MASRTEGAFREVFFTRMSPGAVAATRSQGGAGAGLALSCCPTCRITKLEAQLCLCVCMCRGLTQNDSQRSPNALFGWTLALHCGHNSTTRLTRKKTKFATVKEKQRNFGPSHPTLRAPHYPFRAPDPSGSGPPTLQLGLRAFQYFLVVSWLFLRCFFGVLGQTRNWPNSKLAKLDIGRSRVRPPHSVSLLCRSGG